MDINQSNNIKLLESPKALILIQHYKLDKQEYQIVNESLQWLRNKLRYGENLKDA